jgi:hypothetical protein
VLIKSAQLCLTASGNAAGVGSLVTWSDLDVLPMAANTILYPRFSLPVLCAFFKNSSQIKSKASGCEHAPTVSTSILHPNEHRRLISGSSGVLWGSRIATSVGYLLE